MKTALKISVPVLFLAGLLLASAPARAAVRVAVLFQETHNGKAHSPSVTEEALLNVLSNREGVLLVDPQQASVARAELEGKDLSSVSIKALVTSLEADLLLVGTARYEEFSAGVLDGEFVSVKGLASLRVVAVDSAQIIRSVDADAMGKGFVWLSALDSSAKKLGEKLSSKIEKVFESRAQRFELVVELSERLNAESIDGLLQCVRAQPGTSDVEIGKADAERVKFTLAATSDARALSLQLGRERRCGLDVYAFSKRVLRARFEPKESGVKVLLTRFVPKGRRATKDAWIAREGPVIIGTELAQKGFLQPVDLRKVAGPRAAKGRVAGQLALTGEFRRGKDATRVTVQLVAQRRQRPILTETKLCDGTDLGGCLVELGRQISTKAVGAVLSHRAMIPYEGQMKGPGSDVRVAEVGIKGVFPNRFERYSEEPAGTVRVVNEGPDTLRDIKVRAFLRGFSEEAKVTVVDQVVEPGDSLELPVRLALDRERMMGNGSNQSSTLELDIFFERGDFTHTISHRASAVVYERNAIDWRSAHQSVAAFVDPDAPGLDELVAKVRKAIPARFEQNHLSMPVGLFETLRSFRYSADAYNPFNPEAVDAVQLPHETLQRQVGDCDDLAVAYAAMLEASGIQSLLLLTPGHVLVGVSMPIPASLVRSSESFGERYVVHDGLVYAPIETTLVGKRFSAAWRSGAKLLASLGSDSASIKAVVPRKAWRNYPTISAQAAGTPQLPEVPTVVRMEKTIEGLIKAEADRVTRQVAALEKQGSVDALNEASAILAAAARHEEAARVLTKVMKMSETASSLNNLGNVRFLSGDYSAALNRYERAMEKAPNQLEVHLNSILVLYVTAKTSKERLTRVAKALDRADSIDPEGVSRFLSRLPAGDALVGSSGAVVSFAGLRTLADKHRAAKLEASSLRAARADATGIHRHLQWLD